MAPLPSSLSSSTLSVAVFLLLIAGLLLYRALIPKPLPGIPYSKSAIRPFGDLPAAIAYNKRTHQLVTFLRERCYEVESPIFQIFMRPLGKPWIVIADPREAQDILARRTREFDRANFFSDLFRATAPHNQVSYKTNDKWRANRRLMADTMSPQFLNGVAAPTAHRVFTQLVDIWSRKAALAHDHAFDVALDVEGAMMDEIFTTAFGHTTGTLDMELEHISNLGRLDGLSSDPQAPAVFTRAPMTGEFHAMHTLTASAEIPLKSPFGTYAHVLWLKLDPKLRKADLFRRREISAKLEAAWQKFKRANATEDDVKSATDLVVAREVAMARKQGREPVYDSPTIQDELFGFLGAGYDTTATTIMWGLNFLQKHQDVQTKLRHSLRETFAHRVQERTAPTADEIVKTKTHYLDAVIEEILRLGLTAPSNIRTATEDTEVLGHRIPKGTDVFLLTMGPGYTSPPYPVLESQRSKTSQQLTADRWNGDWDLNSLGHFIPGRWLRQNENGEMEFNAQAGPMQIFGGGLRGCFGKKLAYLSMRILFTLIVWNFELTTVPLHLADFDAIDEMTHRPKKTYVRLQKCA